MDITLWINELSALLTASRAHIGFTLEIVGLLWVIQLINFILGYRLNILGIWPRKPLSLPGIFFAPFLHGNMEHLFFNTIPLVILVDLMLLYGLPVFLWVSVLVMLVSGLTTWLFARPGIHLGASSLLMGYWGFLLMQSYFQPSVVSILIAAICIYYLGSLFLNLLPSGPGVSWEGHVFGCAAGVLGAFIF